MLLCCNLYHYYCILPLHTHTHTYICKEGWLTNRSSLLIILNLVSKPSSIRTIFSLSPLQLAFSPLFLNGFYCCCWCLSSTTIAFICRACLWLLLASFCRSSTHYRNTNSSYRYFIKHPQSCFIETYDHKLSLLVNADAALSHWSRYFSFRWWLNVVSSISCF